MKVLRILAAFVVAEILIYSLITLVQEVIFGGISYYGSPWFDIIFGGLGTFLSAFAAGLAAYAITKRQSVIPHIIVSILLLAESIWLIFYRGTDDPLWFDVLASSSLFVGLWLGVWVLRWKREQPGPVDRAAPFFHRLQ